MFRVNRRLAIATPSSAIALAMLMMASSVPASAQERGSVHERGSVQHATTKHTNQRAESKSSIQQVAGKQIKTQQTRPGLLQVLAGTQERGDRNHQHKNMNNQSRGLLDGLFGGNSRAKQQPSSKSKQGQTRQRSNQSRSNQSQGKTANSSKKTSSM